MRVTPAYIGSVPSEPWRIESSYLTWTSPGVELGREMALAGQADEGAVLAE
jgi:hypothetical protein